MTDQPPPDKPWLPSKGQAAQRKKSPREVWAATSPTDRRKAIITGLVLLAIVIGFVVYAVAGNSSSGGGGGATTPSGLDKAGCMALFDARVGHSTSDNAFWQGLVECANAGLLPPGQNDPGYYSN